MISYNNLITKIFNNWFLHITVTIKIIHFAIVAIIIIIIIIIIITCTIGGFPRGLIVKVIDCGIIVNKFILQSHYYIHFWTNTLGKSMNPLILPVIG